MIKTGKELAAACENVAKNYKTLYVLGCFGAPMNAANKARYSNNLSYNKRDDRSTKIQSASADTFGFDCVCFIKGLLWGWSGNISAEYGGAKYCSNNVPDIDDSAMIMACKDVSTDFSSIQVGEVVWMQGHIGVYIGNGLAAECTPKWNDGVQITAVLNIGAKAGYNGRTWVKHGKLPYITYDVAKKEEVCKVNLKVLKKGSKGENVKALQALLIGYGYKMENNGKTYGIDGSFGGATDNAVRAYQKANGLVVDGSVGPATWSKLLGV